MINGTLITEATLKKLKPITTEMIHVSRRTFNFPPLRKGSKMKENQQQMKQQ